MSKINTIRLININYFGRMIVDEVFHLNNENTLLSLDNGGGKSVIVQMLISPFVHKSYRNTIKDRGFYEYFKDQTPSFILIEWSLDNSNNKLLTGMMVKKSHNADDNNDGLLDTFNFVYEYEKQCEYDIYHIPVLEKKENCIEVKTFNTCKKLFEDFKKRNKNFFSFDTNSHSYLKNYLKKLEEYGIYYSEWENIIKKINEEESGLSKLFIDCKNERGLIEKWFLSSIEKKLNTDDVDKIKEFRNVFEKYLNNYIANKANFKRKAEVDLYNENAEPIKKKALDYIKQETILKEHIIQMTGLRNEIRRVTKIFDANLIDEQQKFDDLNNRIVDIEHERQSFKYYSLDDEKKQHESIIAEYDAKKEKLESILDEKKRFFHSLEAAFMQEKVREFKKEEKEKRQKLEIRREESNTLLPERGFLGFFIKKQYELELERLKLSKENLSKQKQEYQKELDDLGNNIKNLEREINELVSLKSSIDTKIENFYNEENKYRKNWEFPIFRNLDGIYDENAIQSYKQNLIEKQSETEKEIEKQKILLRENEDARENCKSKEIELNKLAAELKNEISKFEKLNQDYESQLYYRKNVLKALELPDTTLFEKDSIIGKLSEIIEQKNISLIELTNKNKELKNEIEKLESGKNIELPAEVISLLKELNIDIVYGYEWLKKQDFDLVKKLDLIKKNKFLPYSLIMTEVELRRLQNSGNKFTSLPIPIITREILRKIEESELIEYPSIKDYVHFYLLFNENLLDEEALKIIIQKKQSLLRRNNDEINCVNQELKNYLDNRYVINTQSVTKELLDKNNKDLSESKEELRRTNEDIIELKKESKLLRLKSDDISKKIEHLNKVQNDYINQIKDFSDLLVNYDSYKINLEEQKSLAVKLDTAESEKAEKTDNQERIREKKSCIRIEESNIENEINITQMGYKDFSSFDEVAKPERISEEIINDIVSAKSRFDAITQGSLKSLKELEEDYSKVISELTDSKKILEKHALKYGLSENNWLGLKYSEEKINECEKEIKSLNSKLDDINNEKSNQKNSLVKIETKQEDVMARIKELGFSVPKERSNVRNIDFQDETSRIKKEVSCCETNVKEIGEKLSKCESAIRELERYKLIDSSESKCTENLETASSQLLQQNTDSAINKYNELNKELGNAKKDFSNDALIFVGDNRFVDKFFRLDTLSNLIDEPKAFLEQLNLILSTQSSIMEKTIADIERVEKDKSTFIELLFSYLQEMYRELNKIDNNSIISFRNKKIKMLTIEQPKWEDNDALYKQKLINYVDEISANCVKLMEDNKFIEDEISKKLSSVNLYDSVVDINEIKVNLYKIESNTEKRITWREVTKNSGGEGFLSAFVVLSSLMYYSRRDDTRNLINAKNEGKVLLMDNPFAQTNAAHLLEPLVELAKKNNTQLICLSGLGGESIYERFDNIYVLTLEQSSLRNDRNYIHSEHKKGEEPQILLPSQFRVSEPVQQLLF